MKKYFFFFRFMAPSRPDEIWTVWVSDRQQFFFNDNYYPSWMLNTVGDDYVACWCRLNNPDRLPDHLLKSFIPCEHKTMLVV